MAFTSLVFIGFFIVLFVGYYIIPLRIRWVWLLLGSYVFYGWASPMLTLFLLFSTFTTWIFPLSMNRIPSSEGKDLSKEERKALRKTSQSKKKVLLVFCLILNVGLLFFLKYTNFFLHLGGSNHLEWLILPLGISFYTFQSVGYCIDVYREMVSPQRNLLKYALYVAFFPQIGQGPIGRYTELAPQLLEGHRFNYNRVASGLTRMLWGFFKKLAVANSIGMFVDVVYLSPSKYSGITLAFATVLYGLQLYADFSGYMDIAIGAGQTLGIRLSENFATPYFSRSITEFWRRWHITLGTWFKDYLYYPILRSGWCARIGKGLSKRGHKKLAQTLTTVIGLAITWVLIGMWHGASWNFLLYGIYHGGFVILAVVLLRIYESIKQKLHIREENWFWRLFQGVRTFAIVSMGYILFRSPDLSTAGFILRRIISNPLANVGTSLRAQLMSGGFDMIKWITICVLLAIMLTAEIVANRAKGGLGEWFNRRRTLVRWGTLYIVGILLWLCTEWGAAGAGNFLYFNF